MEIIQDTARNPSLEAVAVIERLVALQQQQEERSAKKAYVEAMSRVQAQIEPIYKDGTSKNSKFAKLESVDIIVRPMLAAEGFSVSFDEVANTDKTITFVMIISHRAGHSEPRRLTVPIDVASKNREGASIRPAIQDAGSTVSYARRYLLKMHLNIVEIGEDTNGEKMKKLTADEAATMKAKLEEVKGVNPAKFLSYMKVERIEDILKSDEKKAYSVIADAQRVILEKQAPK